MPSPFPGMDPYLEGLIWMSVHQQFISEIARRLAPALRPRYVVLSAERFVYEEEDGIAVKAGDIFPDGGVVDRNAGRTPGPALATIEAPLRIATVVPTAVPHSTVEIRDTAERRLVTAIEVLSPTNKRGRGREEYLAKRRRILRSNSHLVELDFLRAGMRVPMQEPLPQAPWFAFVSRAEDRPITEVWPIPLNERLPEIPIPLLPEDGEVPFDLQSAFETLYDVYGYDLSIDYTQAPAVPLDSDAAAWADDVLKKAGIRK